MTYRMVLPLACALLALSGCGRKSEADKVSAKAPEPSPVPRNGQVVIPPDSPKLQQVKVQTVSMMDVPTDEVVAPGKVETNPNRLSHVVLPLAGKVTRTMVRIGDAVQQGQTLLLMESAEADAAMSATLQADAVITQARAMLVKAQADLDRSKDLYEHNAIAQKEVLSNEASLTQAKAAVEQAEATRKQTLGRLQVLGLKPGEFGQQLAVRAPISGKVLEMSVVPGEFRNDTNAGVVTIADLSNVWITSDVPESSIRFISRGEPVEIELAAYPGETFRGRVARISDMVDPQTRTIKVSAELSNAGGKFRPEMYGRIRHVEATRPCPVVPSGTVIQGDGQNIVYVEHSRGTFQPVPVVLGNKVGEQVAIVRGLKAGDRVVTDGAMLLKGY